MSIFVHGELAEHWFPTRHGVLGAIAEVEISGSKLELRDPAIYAGNGGRIVIGVRAALEIMRQVEAFARLQGFKTLVVTGKRLSGVTPGRPVLFERRIR